MPIFYFKGAQMLGTGLEILSAAAYICSMQYSRYRYHRYKASLQGNTSGLYKN